LQTTERVILTMTSVNRRWKCPADHASRDGSLKLLNPKGGSEDELVLEC